MVVTSLEILCKECGENKEAWHHQYDCGTCSICHQQFTDLRGILRCPNCFPQKTMKDTVVSHFFKASMRLPVLDHGFVELIDVMGDEREVARAARISYGRQDQTRTWEQDAKLIKYLWDNQHTTPFEMIELKFQAKMPIFVARQWVRHRTANINEFSMRYADPERLSEGDSIDYYTPETWRYPDPANKQGSLDGNDYGALIRMNYQSTVEHCIDQYKALQKQGIANEMARMVLPVSVYTEWVWKNDLHNTLHFLKLRTDEHAQWEMRQYANAMLKLLQERLPRLMEIVWSL